jgi:hypothetical protein
MAGIGDGYGSECHLLRFLGRHRSLLNARIAAAIGATSVEWLDVPFRREKRWPDDEWKAVDFLGDDPVVRQAWRSWWPTSGNSLNWDAVGRVRVAGVDEWLLIEAKANEQELASSCAAAEHGGRPLIERSLSEVMQSLGVDPARDWLSGYYQFCNRLAALHFLQEQNRPARLMFIYFTGDRGRPGRTCPSDSTGWAKALQAQADHVGLPAGHRLQDRIHKLFLPIAL